MERLVEKLLHPTVIAAFITASGSLLYLALRRRHCLIDRQKAADAVAARKQQGPRRAKHPNDGDW